MRWLKIYIIVFVAIYIIDINLMYLRHPDNNIPVFKYTIIGLSVVLFILLIWMMTRKKNNPHAFTSQK